MKIREMLPIEGKGVVIEFESQEEYKLLEKLRFQFFHQTMNFMPVSPRYFFLQLNEKEEIPQ